MMKRIGTATALDGRKRQHIEYEISIDTTAAEDLALRANRNKNSQARRGPLHVRILHATPMAQPPRPEGAL
jgi:hypothetical protein